MPSGLQRATPREEVASSLDAAAAEVPEVKGRMADAEQQLRTMLDHPPPDLPRQLERYQGALKKLEAAKEELQDRTEALQREGQEYPIE